ncbi:MAG: ATP synthase F1 subunit delta [Defluviitaleaceae bacterium]|nr:ATP synthase F1 subunit delta [Defluviitaleaceae bacterium]MCL2262032.1 ATP synthase F1 subunit delta [Defluviitaleaceae bacterium]
MADLGIRYATALFGISQESGLLNDYLEQAQLVRDNIESEDAQRILTHPRIASEEKFAFLQKAFEEHIHQDLLGFMRLVISKNREAYLLSALNKLVDMIREHNRQTTARVVSAVPLTDEQAAQITALLEKKLNKQVDVTVLVDPSVIAGISIHVDGYFLDRTVRKMLKDMKENLKGE